MESADARREAEELLSQFEVLYPNTEVVRAALRGMAAYDLSWFDAHMWAYAEVFGLAELNHPLRSSAENRRGGKSTRCRRKTNLDHDGHIQYD